jgi:hypothetical protein
MKTSIENLKASLSKNEELSSENLTQIKGGCSSCTDPKRDKCKDAK